ncbi:hypothetical protein Tco_1406958 [Tanacetum coccineum]
MLHGATAMTVAVMIVPLHTIYPPVAGVASLTETQFDLKPHMQSQRWTDINAGIKQNLQKLYNTNKASLKAAHWVINPETETYDEPSPSRSKLPKPGKEHGRMPAGIPVTCSPSRSDDGELIHSRVLVADPHLLRDTHCLRGSNTETGVPYTKEEIMAIVQKGKQRGYLPGVGRVLPRRAINRCSPPPQSTVDPADVEKLKKSNKSLTKQVKMMMRLFRSDDKFSQMLDQFESSPKFGGSNGSGGCGDDEPGGDEDDDEDEEDGDS